MPTELLHELEALGLGKHACVVEQDVSMKCNWKLGIDTFGETYHFSSLHPNLSQAYVPGIQVLHTFGDEGRDAAHARMTLGRFTTSFMANGEVPAEIWKR